MIRRGGVTDISVVFGTAGNKVSHIYSTLHYYASVISQLRVLASHNTSLGSVALGAKKKKAPPKWQVL